LNNLLDDFLCWGQWRVGWERWEIMGNDRHHFSFCAQKKKRGGEAARNLSCAGRSQVIRTKWIMRCSLAHWYQDNTKYVSSFLLCDSFYFMMISWTAKDWFQM